ncbi:MAG TPA: MBL fold metallo-hydrolase [Pontiellaceae bacterium]|nr:MBL fold metallo-hydrolase [Pontiellaceae bacterium]
MSTLGELQKAYDQVVASSYNGLEIFMMNIGNADCFLVIRYYPGGTKDVVLIDGGNKSDAVDIAKHLTGLGVTHVNHIVNTHSHDDHTGGLIELIKGDTFTYDNLWMPQAWNHIDWQGIKDQLGRNSAKWVLERFQRSLTSQAELYNLSSSKGITPQEPFAGTTIGPFLVLGPTLEFYVECLSSFGDVEKVRQWNDYLERKNTSSALIEAISEILEEDSGTLGGITSPENESSVVLATTLGEDKILFTGDAGCDAFSSIIYNDRFRHLQNIHWMQAPHHGSRRNLSEDLVKLFKSKVVFISAKGSQKHPSRKLVNCLKDNGATVYSSHYPAGNKFTWIRQTIGTVPSRQISPAAALYEAD